MPIVADQWLGETMGVPAFRVDAATQSDGDPAGLGASVKDHAAGAKDAFYYAKVDCARADLVGELSSAGLYVVDTNVVFECRQPPVAQGAVSCPVVAADPARHEAGVLNIAYTAFVYSRFHLDPQVPNEIANTIKREWIRNSLRRLRGDRLFVAIREGEPAGFLAALTTTHGGERVAVIDLIAVAREQQNRRIGEALVLAFYEHYRPSCQSFQVGTQVANIPSMRFYEKLGFRLHRSQYVLHGHARGGRLG